MTPKEKAENMYNNYLIDIKFTMEDCSFTYRGNNYELCVKKTAKQCALIAVEEMIEFEDRIVNQIREITQLSGREFKDESRFWNQVKHEIEKL